MFDEDFVHKLILMYTESGLFVNALNEIKRSCTDSFMKDHRLYHTAKEYVDDVFSFDNLEIGNFYGIFKAYFVFSSIVLIVFVIHLIINFILSRKRRIEFVIYLTFQRFVNMKNRIVFCFKSTCIRIKNLVYSIYISKLKLLGICF